MCSRLEANAAAAMEAAQAVTAVGEAAAQAAAHKEESATRSRPLSEVELAHRIQRAAARARKAAVAGVCVCVCVCVCGARLLLQVI